MSSASPASGRRVGAALRDGDALLAASSMPVRDLEAFLRPGPEGVRFLSNRGANGIDGLVSTATGAAVAAGGRTWAVLGDLALVHDLGGLAAARRAPELRLVVLDNGGGGIFHFLPQAEQLGGDEFEALLGTPADVDPAAALRLFGLTVEEPGEPGGAGGGARGDGARGRGAHRPAPQRRAAPRAGRRRRRSPRLRLAGGQPATRGSSASSLISVSASSAAGSESATIPAPA